MVNFLPPKILICSPLFFGGGSGASAYYRLLASEFISRGYKVSVISDKEAEGGYVGIQYFPLFPERCSRERRAFRDKIAYLKQNFSYFQIEEILSKIVPQSVLVHSSFYNHPGIFSQMMKRTTAKHPEVSFIADVRDALMPTHKVPLLNEYRHVIACSESVAAHLLNNRLDPERLVNIPVIQERLDVDEGLAKELLDEIGIAGRPYIFYGGLIKKSKAVDILLEAYLGHVRTQRKDVQLVIAGLMKTSNANIQEMLGREGVIYLGNRRREEVLALMSRAALCVNLSPNEGMPRSSLEAMALGRPVVLPPNVPEFVRYCGDYVVAERSPSIVAARMMEIMDAAQLTDYPIEQHYPEVVLPAYQQLLTH
jgi:glycosyltransferase involved in cell wall biosynthesis